MAAVKYTYGDGGDSVALSKAFTTTAALASDIVDMRDYDGVALQLIVNLQVDTVSVDAGVDNVVASTKVFSFANYTFTGLVGATITISGAANSGNNGSFVISAVTTHTATCSTASGLVNETFGAGVTVTVTHSETAAKPTGTWTVAMSNNYTPASNGSSYGQAPSQGDFTDCSALFSSPAAIASVTDHGSQFVQPPGHFSARSFQITFTPSGGKGTAIALVYCKSWGK
jgi:hypothetical protein